MSQLLYKSVQISAVDDTTVQYFTLRFVAFLFIKLPESENTCKQNVRSSLAQSSNSVFSKSSAREIEQFVRRRSVRPYGGVKRPHPTIHSRHAYKTTVTPTIHSRHVYKTTVTSTVHRRHVYKTTVTPTKQPSRLQFTTCFVDVTTVKLRILDVTADL